MSSGIVIDTSFYFNQVCVDYDMTSDSCSNWQYYIKEESLDAFINHFNTSVKQTASMIVVFGLIGLTLVWLIKGIFRLILPTKGRN